MKTLTNDMHTSITPAKALKLLKALNKRFINNPKINRNLLQQINETSDGQHAFAVILSSIDDDFVQNVADINVRRTVRAILERSPILNNLIESESFGIAGGMHDIASGEVLFLEDTFSTNLR
jgi:carbonic anhydrase